MKKKGKQVKSRLKMGKRKCVPGNVKAKRRKAIQDVNESIAGSIDKYVVSTRTNPTNEDVLHMNSEELIDGEVNVDEENHVSGDDNNGDDVNGGVGVMEDENGADVVGDFNENMNLNEDGSGVDAENDNNEDENVDGMDVIEIDVENVNVNEDFYDPGNWKRHMSQSEIDLLVLRGPIRVTNVKYPKNGKSPSRSFCDSHYTRSLKNLEEHDRLWLVYSRCADKVYCFCCVLFSNYDSNLTTATKGFNDWGNLYNRLSSHERNDDHITSLKTWSEAETRLRIGATINLVTQKTLSREVEYWKEVLKRIFVVVKTLAANNLAFRGKYEKIDDANNGNFLAIIKMIAEFDPTMKEHLRRIRRKDIHNHYLGHNIQNEMICLLGNQVKNKILEIVKQAKYFSIILDCTPDASHEEQMTLVLRCVNVDSLKVEEFFLEFLKVVDTSGEGLYGTLKVALGALSLEFDDVRGQGYDNGVNMKGKYKGVQSRVLEDYPRAIYIPCACHSLNLSLCDMAICRANAKTFFGVIQQVYKLFSGSTKRWEVLKQYVKGRGSKGLTLKLWTETRWESRFASVKAIRFQAPNIRKALLHLVDHSEDSSCVSEAQSLAKYHFEKFEFLVFIVIWYDVLFHVNKVSKYLQSKEMEIGVAITLIKGLISFFQGYRVDGFENAKVEAKKIADEIGCQGSFEDTRVRRTKTFFDESSRDESSSSKEEEFRTQYFIALMDTADVSLKKRFKQFQQYEEIFSFLYDLPKLRSVNVGELESSCMKLELFLKDGDNFDVDAEDLFRELQLLRVSLPEDTKKPIEVLEYIKGMHLCFPQAWIAYRVLLTIPVTVATAERSFSKLKLIKNYLRSTMVQERLNGLAMMSIEKNVLETLDFSKILSEFTQKKARKVKI